MEKWEELLPEGWRQMDGDGVKSLFLGLKEKHLDLQKKATTFEEAMVVRQHMQAMQGINEHLTEQREKIAEYQAATTEEAPSFIDDVVEEEAQPTEEPVTEAAGDGDDGGIEPPAAPEASDDFEPENELAELLAKAASLGLVVKTEGGDVVADDGEVSHELHRDGFRAPSKDGIGSQLTDEQFFKRWADQMSSDAPGRHTIATINKFDPETTLSDGRALGGGGPEFNTKLIHDTPEPYIEGMASADGYDVAPDPKLASFCGPFETIYAIPDCVTDERKVRSLFRRIPARRGNVEFFRSLGLTDVSALSGIAETWSDVDQGNIVEGDFSTYKACAQVACISVDTTALERLYSCIQVEILLDYGSPEIVQMYMNLISAAHARAAEELLLCRIREESVAYQWTGNYGSTPALAAGLIHLVAVSQFRGRLTRGRYIALVPQGLLQKMDAVDRGATGEMGQPDLRELLGRAGIGLDELIDACDPANSMPAAYTSALPAVGYPGVGVAPTLAATAVYGAETYPVHLITPSDGFYFELPAIDTGLVSSPELARQNSRQMFMETFEGLDKNGCSPWFYVEATVCHDSDRAGFNTVNCT